MMQAVIAGVSIFMGIAIGFWIRTLSAKTEKAMLEQRNREATEALAALQARLAQAQTESVARAGFESLAAEREKTIGTLTAERESTRNRIAGRSRSLLAPNPPASVSLRPSSETSARTWLKNSHYSKVQRRRLPINSRRWRPIFSIRNPRPFPKAARRNSARFSLRFVRRSRISAKKVEEAQSDSKTGVTKLETLIGALNGTSTSNCQRKRAI